MHFRELSTPALTIDLDIVEANLDRMAAYCAQTGIGLRPHSKTHKTPEVAHMQVSRGAVGITVAKVGEAEVMVGAGLDDLLVAYPVWGAEKLKRLATLARERRILLSLDNQATALELSHAMAAHGVTIGVLVEFDSGLGRCGLPPDLSCVRLAQEIEKLPGLQFRGLMTYYGNVWGNEEQRCAEAGRVAQRVAAVLDAFKDAEMPVGIVSGGSTPGAMLTHKMPGITEIRPGTYVYNDLNTFYQGACELQDCAARVVSTVVSTPTPGRVVIDAGSKTLSSDLLGSGPKSGHGYVMEAPGAALVRLNEEHAVVDTTNCSTDLKIGDVISIIPNHVCTCVNLQDEVFLLRNEETIGTWRVAARGKIR